MKKLLSFMIIIILCISFVACGEGDVTLFSVIEKKDIDYNARLTDTVISYKGKTYRYNNGFEKFTTDMTELLKTCQVSYTEDFSETDNQFRISFWSIENSYIYLYFNEADQIKICDDMEINNTYTAKGIYEKVLAYIKPICEETDKYYSLEQSDDAQTSKYEVYSKSGNVLEQNEADRNPHISRVTQNVVCLWIQEGTSASEIINTYFNWETGVVSKSYSGCTDVYQGYLSCGGNNKIEIRKLFDDEILFEVDKLDRPFSDMEDSIISAYFTDDGTQIKVKYADENYEIVEEFIDIPDDIIK